MSVDARRALALDEYRVCRLPGGLCSLVSVNAEVRTPSPVAPVARPEGTVLPGPTIERGLGVKGIVDHIGLVDPGGYGRARFAAITEIGDLQALPMPEEGLEPPTRGL